MTGTARGGHLLLRRELDLARRSCRLGTRWWCRPHRRAQPCSESRDCTVAVAGEHLVVGGERRSIIGGCVSTPPHPRATAAPLVVLPDDEHIRAKADQSVKVEAAREGLDVGQHLVVTREPMRVDRVRSG